MGTPSQFRDSFATTQWSIVLAAGDRREAASSKALAELCQAYWFPLYAYVRRRTKDLATAQDLTQEFFVRLLETDLLSTATQERGRFRAFLLTCMRNFLANENDRARALKRGGGRPGLSLDWESGESRLSLHPSHELTPERLFDRNWAFTLLEHVLERLAIEFSATGKARQFEALKDSLTGDRNSVDYPVIAANLNVSADAARQAVHRLRKRYRELLRDEVAQTVADSADVDDEIRSLFEILG